MTVKELIERLSLENPNANVYTLDRDDDVALIVTDIRKNVLQGSDETIVLVY